MECSKHFKKANPEHTKCEYCSGPWQWAAHQKAQPNSPLFPTIFSSTHFLRRQQYSHGSKPPFTQNGSKEPRANSGNPLRRVNHLMAFIALKDFNVSYDLARISNPHYDHMYLTTGKILSSILILIVLIDLK